MRSKAVEKKKRFPEAPYTVAQVRRVWNFTQYDNLITAPVHGYKDADHYYSDASSHQYIPSIQVPVLLLNAQNDPFLTEGCYPIDLAKDLPYVHLVMPRFGGHVGFSRHNWLMGEFYSEMRARQFFGEVL